MKSKISRIAGERHVPNRRFEARLVDHDPRDALLFHQLADGSGLFGLGPLAMAQLHGQAEARAAHATDQILQVLERAGVGAEAGWELSEQGAEFAGLG